MNVIDYYKNWEATAILGDLNTKRNNFTVIASNLENDFNIATCIRNSNAFMASEVWIYGRKQYDRRGTVGTHHYTNFKHVKTIENVEQALVDLRTKHGEVVVVGMDNIDRAININHYEWDKNIHTVMVFGQEKNGIPHELLNLCDDVVYIPQYGSVRSLNVGTASGIAMHSYCSSVVDRIHER